MPDWQAYLQSYSVGVLSTAGMESVIAQFQALLGGAFDTAAAWPAANTALYCPVIVNEPITVYQMSIIVGAQAGNFDVGIYNENGDRLVSAGSTAVGAAGIQVFNITDTNLGPGNYYLAGNCSTVTTATFMKAAPQIPVCRMSGCRQQAVGSVTLPNPATFANYGAAYVPLINAHYINATV